jgi:tetratricopeptide (TPR) repeat protein
LLGRALLVRASLRQDLATALPLAQEAAEQFERAESPAEVAWVLTNVGFLAIFEEDYAQAAELLDDALDAALTAAAAPRRLAAVHGNRGLAALFRDRYDEAADAFRAELITDTRVSTTSEGLVGLAAIAAATGDHRRAALLSGAGAAIAGDALYGPDAAVLERVRTRFIEPGRAACPEAVWRDAEREGRSLPAPAAVAVALEGGTA